MKKKKKSKGQREDIEEREAVNDILNRNKHDIAKRRHPRSGLVGR